MDAVQFQQRAREDAALRGFLEEVAAGAGEGAEDEEPRRYVTGGEVLFGIAAYALFRWLKDGFDHRRALREAEVLRQQGEVLAALIRDGLPPKQAQAAVVALLKGIARRADDDPALKAARALLGETRKA